MSRFDRQSFLGPNSEMVLATTIVGIIGLGGGGSHEVQQLAYLGVLDYVLVDDDVIEDTNLNRLVGGRYADIKSGLSKVSIAERVIRQVSPRARIRTIRRPWQDAVDDLLNCDVIFGAVDSYVGRDQLERFCRRHLIPYIDIGMDVHNLGEAKGFLVSGQAIISSPGHPCLWCCGLITDEKLKQEAEAYGEAGGRPQVIWPNGVLASTAVGLFIQSITPWHQKPLAFDHLIYDGNRGTIVRAPSVEALRGTTCHHHPLDELGDPLFDIRSARSSAPKKKNSKSDVAARSMWSWILRRMGLDRR